MQDRYLCWPLLLFTWPRSGHPHFFILESPLGYLQFSIQSAANYRHGFLNPKLAPSKTSYPRPLYWFLRRSLLAICKTPQMEVWTMFYLYHVHFVSLVHFASIKVFQRTFSGFGLIGLCLPRFRIYFLQSIIKAFWLNVSLLLVSINFLDSAV